jgi:hypothetical protein
MGVVLLADLDSPPGDKEVPNAWRGLLDLGEVWGGSTKDLWPSQFGAVRTGESLTYGCEVTHDPQNHHRVAIKIWSLDEPTEAMSAGARFTLRDGLAARATGKFV